nr:hypothetical protein [Tanacetum cinerariifolium]
DSEEELEKVVFGADEGGQGKGQAGPDPGAQAEGQMGSDAGDQDEGQAGSNPDEISEGQARLDPGNAGADEKKRKQATKTSDKPPKAKKSKYGVIGKKRSLKSVATSEAEDVPVMEPQVAAKDTDLQKALEESMKTTYALPRGPLPPVVIGELKSGKYQPLSEVPGKGKAKVTEEQVAHDLLSLQKPKKKSPADQYIFQRRISKPTGSSKHDESPYAMLG